MAEQSTLHHWINTAIAAIAVAVSGASLYYANSANNLAKKQAALDRENIGVHAESTFKCPWSISPAIASKELSQPGELGLCWKVDLWNRSVNSSEIKTVDVDYVPNYYKGRISLIDVRILSLVITRTDKSSLEKQPPINQKEIVIPGRNRATVIIQVMLPYSPNINDTVSAFMREHPDNPTL